MKKDPLATGNKQQLIEWLSQQDEETKFEIHTFRETRSLNQNRLYWEIVGLISKNQKKPDCYIHNILLRRCHICEMLGGKVVYIPLPDTDEAEKETEYSVMYHYCPTTELKENEETGEVWRWYKMLKGSSSFTKEEMCKLIDIALDEMRCCEIELPWEAAIRDALDEHERIRNELRSKHNSNGGS